MASSDLEQQRRTDEANRSSIRQVVSMRVFFTSRHKDVHNVRCIEAYSYKVERQLDTNCRAIVQLRRYVTNAIDIARNWRFARPWRRRVVALVRFVMTRRTSTWDPSLSTQRTYVYIANRTKERAKDHAKHDGRHHNQSKHFGSLFLQQSVNGQIQSTFRPIPKQGRIEFVVSILPSCRVFGTIRQLPL